MIQTNVATAMDAQISSESNCFMTEEKKLVDILITLPEEKEVGTKNEK